MDITQEEKEKLLRYIDAYANEKGWASAEAEAGNYRAANRRHRDAAHTRKLIVEMLETNDKE